MCEVSSWRLKPQPLLPLHFTNTYTYRVTIAPRVCGDNN